MERHGLEGVRSRRGLLLVALIGVVLVGVAGWLATGPGTIRLGMTRDEVDARLGPPNGRMLAVGGTALKDVVLVWKDRGLAIEFDEDNRVREVRRSPSLIDNLRGKVGL